MRVLMPMIGTCCLRQADSMPGQNSVSASNKSLGCKRRIMRDMAVGKSQGKKASDRLLLLMCSPSRRSAWAKPVAVTTVRWMLWPRCNKA